MSIVEQPLAFPCEGERLVGVATLPPRADATGVIILVGGPQYRVGSHRQFTLLARRLAAEGVAALRFDYRGMGDSTGVPPPFDAVNPDIAAAIAALQSACPAVERVVLWGLCDAASSALLYRGATGDARVAGIVLLNPWIRSEETLARTYVRHYYGRRLLESSFWKKLVKGGVDVRGSARSLAAGLSALVKPARATASGGTFQDRMAESLEHFAGPVLLLLSERDFTAREFMDYVAANTRWSCLVPGPRVERVTVAGADHTFSSAAWRREVEDRMLDWLRRHRLASR